MGTAKYDTSPPASTSVLPVVYGHGHEHGHGHAGPSHGGCQSRSHTPLGSDSAGYASSQLERDVEACGSSPSYAYPTSDAERLSPVSRLALRARRIPLVARAWDRIDWVLGPRLPTDTYSPPSSPVLEFALTLPGIHVSPRSVDAAATRITKRYRLHHLWLPYLLLWATGLVLLTRAAYYLPSSPAMLGCTSSYWEDWPPDACGLNGMDCAPALEPGVYRCPAGCQATPLGNPRWVGGNKTSGVPLIVGGGDGVYRADSWICPAAAHARAISPTFGGCISLSPLPYPSGASNFLGSRGGAGLRSLSFTPHFPAAFTLAPAGSSASCIDYHWPMTAYNVIMLFVFTSLFSPAPVVQAATIIVLGYLHIVLAADPRARPPDWSYILGGAVPVLLAGYWMWNVSLRRTLSAFAAQGLPLEIAIWQGFGFWVGEESSTLFAHIPISRLGYGALPPGGVVALVVIVVVVVAVVAVQALEMRRAGLLRYYLARYIWLVPILLVLGNLGNGYYLRLHHYLISLAGMPVVSLPNRISLFGQAFLLGWFMDGVGRWGWASIVEGAATLLGDANLGTALPALAAMAGDLLEWPPANATLVDAGFSAVRVILDDVLVRTNFTGTVFNITDATPDLGIDHYFRIAYVANGTSLDYSMPVTWFASNQSWGSVDV